MSGRKSHVCINSVVSILGICIAIGGGILSYIFVGRYEAKVNYANTVFTETKNKLAEIELSVKYLKEELNITEKRLKVSSEIMEIFTNIIPSAVIDEVEATLVGDEINYYAKLTNTGKLPFSLYAIDTKGPPNTPYTEDFFPSLPSKHIDKTILPGQSYESHITFTFKDAKPKLNDEFDVNYRVQTMDSIKQAFLSILKDVLSEEEINRISKGSYPCSFKCIKATE